MVEVDLEGWALRSMRRWVHTTWMYDGGVGDEAE